ncbi:uncharacterized protein LOC135810032 [Sycon ciliatum]|uniref:uncharacterized protein LOC135810032 n=1 Tax=Sycon ciliatum TaxID=27933 RepID=UPI0031F67295
MSFTSISSRRCWRRLKITAVLSRRIGSGTCLNMAETPSRKVAKGIDSIVITSGIKGANVEPTTAEVTRNAFMMAGCCSAFAGVCNQHGGPFGATVTKDNQIVSCMHNTVLQDENPTRHGEMNAIRQACANLRSADLTGCDMYTTCEPCPMCWGAIQRSGIRDMYIGVDRYLAAEFGFNDKAYYDEIALLHNTLNSKEQAQPVVSNFLTVRIGNPLKALVQDKLLGRGDATIGGSVGDLSWLTVSRRDQSSTSTDGDAEAECSAGVDERFSTEQHAKFSEQLVSYASEMIAKHGSGAQPDGHEACILVDTQTAKVIACGSTLTANREDASSGFVTSVVEEACRALSTRVLDQCIVYCTVEPDPMNFCSLLWASVPVLHIGLSQSNVDAQRSRSPASRQGERSHQIFEHFFEREERKKHEKPGTGSVMREECANVFRKWQHLNGLIY